MRILIILLISFRTTLSYLFERLQSFHIGLLSGPLLRFTAISLVLKCSTIPMLLSLTIKILYTQVA